MEKANCNGLIRSDHFQPALVDLDNNIHDVTYLDTQKFLDDNRTMGLLKQFSFNKGGRKMALA